MTNKGLNSDSLFGVRRVSALDAHWQRSRTFTALPDDSREGIFPKTAAQSWTSGVVRTRSKVSKFSEVQIEMRTSVTTAVSKLTKVEEMKALATKIRAEKETKAQLNAYWAGAAAELAALDELQKVRGTELTEILHMDTALFLEAGEDVKGIPEEASDILSRLAEATRQHQEIAAALQKGGSVDCLHSGGACGLGRRIRSVRRGPPGHARSEAEPLPKHRRPSLPSRNAKRPTTSRLGVGSREHGRKRGSQRRGPRGPFRFTNPTPEERSLRIAASLPPVDVPLVSQRLIPLRSPGRGLVFPHR